MTQEPSFRNEDLKDQLDLSGFYARFDEKWNIVEKHDRELKGTS